MSRSMAVLAQAKINLRLKVLELGASGFHAIETVFLRLALADDVVVTTADGGGIELDVTGDPSLVVASGPAARNLAVTAARAYCDRAGWHPGVAIRIEKKIPVGAGLGGGSADAAAVLRALDALAPAPLPRAELLALAGTLGSDVPFLASDHAMALGWGRGERLLTLDALPERPIVLGVPAVHVSTRDAYAWLGRSRGAPSPPPTLPMDAFGTWEGVAQFAENDFAEPVARRHPVTEEIRKSLLARGARVAMLCGSGSCVFGVFDSAETIGPREEPASWAELQTTSAAHVVPLEPMD